MRIQIPLRALTSAGIAIVLWCSGDFSPQLHAQAGAAAGSSAVAVDFRAIGPDGTPILDLKAEEVTLKVDNKARALKSLTLVKQTAPPAAALPVLPAPYVTNVEDVANRSTLIIVDDVTIKTGQERGMRDALDKFVAALPQTDRVGLLTIPAGGVRVDVSADHQKVRDALTNLRGMAPVSQTSTEAQCRARESLQALAGTLTGLSGGSVPITIVFYSSKMVGPTESARLGVSRDVGGTGVGSCVVETLEWQKVGQAAAESHAQFYIVVPDDAAADDIKTREGLEHLAGVTGGQVAHTTSGGENSLARVMRETTAYYVATFEPEPTERNGAGHALDLKINRPNTVVRVRPEIPLPPLAAATKITPRDMLREARMYRDVPLRSASFFARNPGDDKVKIITLFEPNQPGATLTSATIGIYDDAGRLTAQWTSQASDFNKLPVMAALAVPAGKYRVRVAATDSAGRAGTVDASVDASLPETGGLKYSSLMLGDPQGGLAFKLQFAGNANVMTYLEIYGVGDPKTVSATIELAETVDGPAVASGPADVGRSGATVTTTGGFGIGGLPPGDYIIRVVIGVNGQAVAKTTRTLRKIG